MGEVSRFNFEAHNKGDDHFGSRLFGPLNQRNLKGLLKTDLSGQNYRYIFEDAMWSSFDYNLRGLACCDGCTFHMEQNHVQCNHSFPRVFRQTSIKGPGTHDDLWQINYFLQLSGWLEPRAVMYLLLRKERTIKQSPQTKRKLQQIIGRFFGSRGPQARVRKHSPQREIQSPWISSFTTGVECHKALYSFNFHIIPRLSVVEV